MRPYLNNFIQTLSRHRQERVADLLEEARIGKEQLDTLMSRLEGGFNQRGSVILGRHERNSPIGTRTFIRNIYSIRTRIEELFEMSNTISVLLNSSSAMLTSEVRAIEDELREMEKMIFNFAFLLSENQAYHYAFLEAFNDELNRDTEIERVPDRSSLPFGPADKAFVHKDEGELSIPESMLNSHSMGVHLVKGNATALTVSDSGIDNVLKQGTWTGWKQTVLAGGPITAPLPGNSRDGAQVVLEFRLVQPSPCSEIKLTPYADLPVELLQVTTFEDENDMTGTDHLSTVHRLSGPYILHFPMQPVYKFHITLNQPTYHRVTKYENILEFNYNRMIESINQSRANSGDKDTYKRVHVTSQIEQSLVLATMNKGEQSVSIPVINTTVERGPMGPSKLSTVLRFSRPDAWKEGTEDKSEIVYDALKSSNNDANRIRRNDGDFTMTKNTRQLAANRPIRQIVTKTIDTQVIGAGYTYYYNLGLHYVGIGVESPGFKASYISKPLPSTGDIGVIRMKTEEENYFITNTARHSSQLTSVEYSVSNKSDPVNEVDWKPILPIGTSQVQGERIFLDDSGRGYLRFKASASDSITIYRNGYSIGFGGDNMNIVYGDPGVIVGVKIDLAAMSAEDIFTCDYYPYEDATTISFEDDNYLIPPLVSAHEEDGAGERFITTGERNTVSLSRVPYIHPDQSKIDGFRPIVVQIDDGHVAHNLTDYKNNRSIDLPEDGYYFIHSGNTLMFNRAITTPFRVYYDYLQNNTRFRVILRCNSKDFTSPKVNYVHCKAKVRESEMRSI